ncbi:response regulator transcription factor [Ideonella sp. BN130291]|uniref:response regulator transcription factor n=1 Tax=Ideonella sp. BN130291 TaxID=3112940 RepID=UPI002E254E85|nr:response regulator transcription factor [Ideonella sp. BN130291]
MFDTPFPPPRQPAEPASHVLVVDDHPMARAGLQQFLAGIPGVQEVVAVADADGVDRALAQRGPPRLAIVDFWLSSGDTESLLRHLMRQAPDTAVLVVSGDDRPEVVAQARRAGARGFVSKAEPPETVRHAVVCVLEGGCWFSPARAAAGPQREIDVRPADLGLTQQQGRVLALLLDGQPNKRIAQALGVADSTIKEHVTAVLRRLDVATRMEAIALLRGRRLVLAAGDQPAAPSSRSQR